MDDRGENDDLHLWTPVSQGLTAKLHARLTRAQGESGIETDDEHLDGPRQRFADSLSRSSRKLDENGEQALVTTFPYLLYSPDSPLRLLHEMPLSSTGARAQGQGSMFPYCAAFEDLILLSQGRDMHSLQHHARMAGRLVNWNKWHRPAVAWDWLENLQGKGLLVRKMSSMALWEQDMNRKAGLKRDSSPLRSDPETELDAYDGVLNSIMSELQKLNGILPWQVAETLKRHIQETPREVSREASGEESNATSDVSTSLDRLFRVGLGLVHKAVGALDTHGSIGVDNEARGAVRIVDTVRAAESDSEAKDKSLSLAHIFSPAPSQQSQNSTQSTYEERRETNSHTTSHTSEKILEDGTKINTTIQTHIAPSGIRTTYNAVERVSAAGVRTVEEGWTESYQWSTKEDGEDCENNAAHQATHDEEEDDEQGTIQRNASSDLRLSSAARSMDDFESRILKEIEKRERMHWQHMQRFFPQEGLSALFALHNDDYETQDEERPHVRSTKRNSQTGREDAERPEVAEKSIQARKEALAATKKRGWFWE